MGHDKRNRADTANTPTVARPDGAATLVETSPTSLERPAVRSPPRSSRATTRDGRRHLVSAPATDKMTASVMRELRRPSALRLRRLERHAEGGMGSIDVVIDEALARRVAMKVMRPELRDDARCLRLFLREARVTAQLEHPNIVPVHEVGEDSDERLYFTMKLVEGRTLKALIRELPERATTNDALYNILDIVTRVCDALAFAHSRGVLHCDIKPSNVMVGDYGAVYLMDWGVARLLSEHAWGNAAPGQAEPDDSRAGVAEPPDSDREFDKGVLGTAAYMSPEQALGLRERLDERSDVFQTGALIYEILTGRPPFDAGSYEEALKLARKTRYAPLDVAIDGSLPPRELLRIVDKAMARRRADRYQSVAELKEDLVRFLRGGGEFPRIAVQSGEHIMREGEVGDTAYIIDSGRVEIYRLVDGQRIRVGVMGPGEVVGETAVLTSEPRNASVVALQPTVLHVVSGEVIDREVDAMKPWLGSLLRSLARRFRETADEASLTRQSSRDES